MPTAEKERKIYDLKKKNQELEKFKFVLDFKIKELKKQIEPRENQISAMQDRVKDMDAELERYHKINSQLDERIGELRKELNDTQASTKNKMIQARNLVCLSQFFNLLPDSPLTLACCAFVDCASGQIQDGAAGLYAEHPGQQLSA